MLHLNWCCTIAVHVYVATWTLVCVSPLWTSAGKASAAPRTCQSPAWTWRTGCPPRWWSSSSPGGSAHSPPTWWSWWTHSHTPAHTPWRLLQSVENGAKLQKGRKSSQDKEACAINMCLCLHQTLQENWKYDRPNATFKCEWAPCTSDSKSSMRLYWLIHLNRAVVFLALINIHRIFLQLAIPFQNMTPQHFISTESRQYWLTAAVKGALPHMFKGTNIQKKRRREQSLGCFILYFSSKC